ncbi:MAG: hypothetical protein R2856_30115 [Caldilineaceae bacterium]
MAAIIDADGKTGTYSPVQQFYKVHAAALIGRCRAIVLTARPTSFGPSSLAPPTTKSRSTTIPGFIAQRGPVRRYHKLHAGGTSQRKGILLARAYLRQGSQFRAV